MKTVWVVKATATQWYVLCPYCDKTHAHGRLEGPRAAHCGAAGGYFIKRGLLPAPTDS